MSETEKQKYDTEDDSSIDSNLVSEDDSIESDLESIYSDLLHSISTDSDFETSDDENESISTGYVSSGISIKLLDEELFEDESDERELAVIIEVNKSSTNYTDTIIRKIYKKKTNNYDKINLSIAIFTFAVILNWIR
jgi:hypothetical protein